MAPRYFKFEMITLPLVATVKMCEKMIMIDKWMSTNFKMIQIYICMLLDLGSENKDFAWQG